MTDWVLDASAVLAFMLGETGGTEVGPILSRSVLTSVNLAEVVGRLSNRNMPEDEMRDAIDSLECEIVSVSREVGLEAGRLRASTRHKGLSLGDRVCLAFAKQAAVPVLTAHRPWADLDIGVDVRLIR